MRRAAGHSARHRTGGRAGQDTVRGTNRRSARDHLSLLTGSKAASGRHQTLRAALDWSYDLLNESEQTLLRRLSVFAGGWSLDAVETVCTSAEPATEQVLDVLKSLADKSLVLVEPVDRCEDQAILAHKEGSTRYRLLETVRQYATERLGMRGETESVRLRHRDYFLTLAEEAARQLKAGDLEPWLRRVESEHANLRAALAWTGPNSQDAQAGLRLAGALGSFWNVRGHFSEGRRQLQQDAGREVDHRILQIRSTIGDDAFAIAWEQGNALTLEQAVAYALADRY